MVARYFLTGLPSIVSANILRGGTLVLYYIEFLLKTIVL